MLDVKQAYNSWAEQYDTNQNKTRDLEAKALRQTLAAIRFDSCLEIGCGTGKNTEWLVQQASRITAVDLSEEMLAKAREKITSGKVHFQQADINEAWTFREGPYDLVTFSLVLEHIEHLEPIFWKTAQSLRPGGHAYIGELHPFKQYTGTKARFDTEEGRQIVTCFDHHVSDFVQAARRHGLSLVDVQEFFDDNVRVGVPRILVLLVQKT
ncbi:MAG: class I SAM-dependent methyltransferase [Lewinellaceae bacterium]|nr:class I SAM-dependent methyltransferase [Saprospiraceae bacterium]MCB9341416.1 class I SAM-dependent methyltransferase [Lewinellaceae bacterium]